ncbi:MAG TPA: ferritin-like domain-containing protein [Chitinophagaceae bacterium]|jgi:ferritin-like metal-binding protein YciE|nr:ferritin-like domain-containing protein [Chitinophagaceae bacterium]
MENMNQLRDLLKHEIKDLYSAEEQIIEALPKMIEKANNKDLKKALKQHLEITEKQKDRLDQVLEAMNEEREEEGEGPLGLFKGEERCLAMEGLIKEGEKLMKEDMSPEVSDAAIIAAAQKIEHYEISSYGTARTYAEELNLNEIEDMLKQTLDEEYEADDLLTELAESRVNEKAIHESGSGSARQSGRSGSQSESSNGKGARIRSTAMEKASSSRSSSSRSGSSGKSSRSSASPKKTKNSSGRDRSSSSRSRSSR